MSSENLQHRLQAIIDSAGESWTCTIFWQDFAEGSLLGWGDGYYKGGDDDPSSSSAAEQEHCKNVSRQLNSRISGGSSDDAVDEEVTDTKWFFLISIGKSFVNGAGLPGQSFFSNEAVWIAGQDRLASSTCEKARKAQLLGLQTMVCIPLPDGVVEFGSSDLIVQSPDLMNQVRVLFNATNQIQSHIRVDSSGRDSCMEMSDNDFLNASGFVPHESSPDIGQASKKGGRQSNFTNEEDKLLISAWLNVSLDPILGSGQKRTTFWTRVEQYFNDNKTWPGDRTSTSLMNRWSSINQAVAKFIGCYEQIESLNRSGTTEDNRIADAKTMYHACHKVSFVFENCWRLLRYEQKWLDKVAEGNRQQMKKKKASTPSKETVNLDDDDAMPGNVTFERPMGRKAAKQQKSDNRSDANNAELLKVMMSDIMKAKMTSVEQKGQMYEKGYEIEKMKADKLLELEKKRIDNETERLNVEKRRTDNETERLNMEKQKMRLDQQERDERIIAMDTSMMAPDVQAYYRRRRQEILARSD